MAYEHVPPAFHGFVSYVRWMETESVRPGTLTVRDLYLEGRHTFPSFPQRTAAAASAGCFIGIPALGGNLSASVGTVSKPEGVGRRDRGRRCCCCCPAGLAGVLLKAGFCEGVSRSGRVRSPGFFLGRRAVGCWEWGPREERQGPCAVFNLITSLST